MTDTARKIINDQQEWIRKEYFATKADGDILPYMALKDIEEVTRSPGAHRREHEIVLKELPGGSGLETARIAMCETLGYSVMWARYKSRSDRTYAEDFAAFIKYKYGHPTGKFQGFHADHVFSLARAEVSKEKWTVVCLCPASVNTSHGAKTEKSILAGLTGSKEQRLLDTIGLLKCYGIRIFKGDGDTYQVDEEALELAARQLSLSGIDLSEDIDFLKKVTDFRPCET
ncbi:hypothetical protein [Paraburkholderia tropica]|uniref:hypothetical protein n=1 Tax=Paraburkholderia tropica TaxID=92647 RepID=UPI002AB7BB40|nr:hypothetical protein [Paraburkholderia tropica]